MYSHVWGIYSLTLTAARLNVVFGGSSIMGRTEISQLYDGLPWNLGAAGGVNPNNRADPTVFHYYCKISESLLELEH